MLTLLFHVLLMKFVNAYLNKFRIDKTQVFFLVAHGKFCHQNIVESEWVYNGRFVIPEITRNV